MTILGRGCISMELAASVRRLLIADDEHSADCNGNVERAEVRSTRLNAASYAATELFLAYAGPHMGIVLTLHAMHAASEADKRVVEEKSKGLTLKQSNLPAFTGAAEGCHAFLRSEFGLYVASRNRCAH